MAVPCVKNHYGRTYFDEFMPTCLRGAVFFETECSSTAKVWTQFSSTSLQLAAEERNADWSIFWTSLDDLAFQKSLWLTFRLILLHLFLSRFISLSYHYHYRYHYTYHHFIITICYNYNSTAVQLTRNITTNSRSKSRARKARWKTCRNTDWEREDQDQ